MRPISTAVCRRIFIPAFALIVASSGADRAAAQGGEPAEVIPLGDGTANWFLNLDPPPPPDGQVLVAGSDEGKVFAFVLGRTPEEAEKQLAQIKVAGEIEGCERGGVTCCDAQNKVYVLDGEFQGERFWLRLGEFCEGGPPEEGVADGAPVDEADAAVVEVDPAIMNQLTAYGVTYPFMTLAEESGNGRILVDPSYESGELGLPSRRQAGVRDFHPLIIRANHVIQQERCRTSVPYCKKEEGDRCNEAGRHWWRWDDSRDKWCRMADTCGC